jgi:hypothetical protein
MKGIFILLSFLFIGNVHAQLNFNLDVDTLDDDVKQAIHFYEAYLNSFKNRSLPDFTKYWPEADCKAYKYPDQMLYAISGDGVTYRLMGKPTVLYIKPGKDDIHIKTSFGLCDSAGNVSTLCITNHYITKDNNGHLRFINPISINGKDWRTTTVRNITYYYPPYHKFDEKRADSMVQAIAKLEKDWNLKPIHIRYYFADTKEELQHLRGFDYAINMGNRDKPTGISDDRDDLVYCSGLGEYYFHEVVHIYLNRLFPESPLREGMAVFYGGTLGHDLAWHVRRLNKYLEVHKEIDLGKDNFSYMDNYTNPWSTIKGSLCALAYKKDGLNGLKRILSYKSMDDIFKREFGVSPGKQDDFIRKTIDEIARSAE